MNDVRHGWRVRATLCAGLFVSTLNFLHAADALTWQQKEQFLTKAKITKTQPAKKGVTGAIRATMTDGTMTHDAKVQTVDETKQFFLGEVGFKDTYKFNVAGWKLARMLGIDDMVAPSVKRNFQGMAASFDWWIEDIVMDEEDRRAKKLQPPDADAWQKENSVMEAFDQLIYNIDRNLTNMQIDKNGRLWLIDHTRAFRLKTTLKDPGALKTVDRNMLARMKTLDEATLTKEFGRDVTKDEIRALLARRDSIVKFFDGKGEGALFDRPVRN